MASAMKANAMVGGDNASRSIAIGMVMVRERPCVRSRETGRELRVWCVCVCVC